MTNTTDKSVDPMSLQRTRGEKGKFDTNEKWQKKVCLLYTSDAADE